MKKIKILQMPIANTQGGLTQYVLQNWKFINRDRFQFDFVTLSKFLDFADKLINEGCKIHYLSCSSMENVDRFIVEMKKVLAHDYDAIHLHTSYWNGFLAEILAKECGCQKIIVHSHSTLVDAADDKRRAKLIEEHNEYKKEFSEEYATHFCACSKASADWLFGQQIPRDKIRIMNNAIDVKRFVYSEVTRNQYRESFGIKNDFVIGFVGRLSYAKNPHMVMEIFKKLCEKVPNAKLLLVGTGPLEVEIHDLAYQLGIIDNILFLGRREDVAQLMQAMDVFILPSRFEGLGLVLIEAQAAGLKCIASSNIPLETKITPDVEYLPDDIELWVDEIVKYSQGYVRSDNIELIKNAGYSLEEQIKEVEKLYEE